MVAYPNELSELSQVQLSRFSGFFKGKHENTLRAIEGEKQDFYSDHLADESAIFNTQDVLNLLETFYQQVTHTVTTELNNSSSLAGVYASMLFAQAEASGLTLQVEDISVIEDQSRVDQISGLAALKAAPPPMPKPRQVLEAVGGSTADPATLQALEEAQERNRQLEDRAKVMQTEVSSLLKERSTLSAELDKVKQNFKNLMQRMHETDPGSASSTSAAEINRALNDTKSLLDAKSAECEQMRKDLNNRLGDSTQFRDLKAIVQKKSAEIKQYKTMLMQHGLMPMENEGVELEADDDD